MLCEVTVRWALWFERCCIETMPAFSFCGSHALIKGQIFITTNFLHLMMLLNLYPLFGPHPTLQTQVHTYTHTYSHTTHTRTHWAHLFYQGPSNLCLSTSWDRWDLARARVLGNKAENWIQICKDKKAVTFIVIIIIILSSSNSSSGTVTEWDTFLIMNWHR